MNTSNLYLFVTKSIC